MNVMNMLLRFVGWTVVIVGGIAFLVFVGLPLLDTNDSVVFESGPFALSLGRFAAFIGVFGVLPLWLARWRSRRANRKG